MFGIGMVVLEGDELCFVGINAQAIAHEPVNDHVKPILAFLNDGLVGGSRCNDRPVIDIGGERMEPPLFRDM